MTVIKGKNQFDQNIEVEMEKGIIKSISFLPESENLTNYIVPGFIEIHSHGGYGFDWINPDVEAAKKFLYEIAKNEGTTSILGTTITTSSDKIQAALSINKVLIGEHINGANLIGFHLEGPFINPQKKGAHPVEYMKPLTLKNLEQVVDKHNINTLRTITFAPELTTKKDVLDVAKLGIKLQIGHSMATDNDYEKVHELVSAITHFNNAMIKYNQPNNSLAKIGLKNKDLYVEFINDGVHNSKELAKLILEQKPEDKIILITDSLHVKGLADGDYSGPNWKITKKNGAAWTPEGILNGSVYTLDKAFRDWINLGATINQAVHATSTNAAKYLGLKKGKIQEGYDADIVILDSNLKVIKTYVNGEEII